MIYDCFTYNCEESVLLLRWHELLPIQNLKHVIVQADKTFTGDKKNIINYDNNRMIPIYVTDMPDDCDAWAREAHQRNSIMRGLSNAKDDDIIIISDVDEIPRLEAVREFIDKGYDFAALKMDIFWYKFNCLAEKQTWVLPRIMTFKYLKESTPQKVRESGYPIVIDNAGWHFSFLGDEDFISTKLSSYSHVEFNVPEFNNKEHIKCSVENGTPLWGIGNFNFVKIDETFPKYLYENQDKFKHLIKAV